MLLYIRIKMENKKKQSKFKKYFRWPLIVLVLSFTLSMAFGVLSEIALSGAGIAISIVVIVVFLFIAIITDMIGVAITACDEKNFRAMASRKVRGAKEAIILQKNADRVSSIFADILGDICSILSGAAGAAVTTALITQRMSNFLGIVIASLVSAVIAALLIFGKALMKRYSMNHADKIVLIMGKVMSIFHFSKKDKSQKKKSGKPKSSLPFEEKDGQEPAVLPASNLEQENIEASATTETNDNDYSNEINNNTHSTEPKNDTSQTKN